MEGLERFERCTLSALLSSVLSSSTSGLRNGRPRSLRIQERIQPTRKPTVHRLINKRGGNARFIRNTNGGPHINPRSGTIIQVSVQHFLADDIAEFCGFEMLFFRLFGEIMGNGTCLADET
jgi:hypothetical protein